MAGKKKLRRRLYKKVLAGTMTVDEVRARLGRDVAQKSYGSAWSTWPEQSPAYQPREPDWEYLLEAARTKIPVPQPQISKVNKAHKRYDRHIAPVREMLAKALACSTVLSAAPAASVVVKQLSGPERAMVAALEQRLVRVAGDPALREGIKDQIAQITGLPYTGAV